MVVCSTELPAASTAFTLSDTNSAPTGCDTSAVHRALAPTTGTRRQVAPSSTDACTATLFTTAAPTAPACGTTLTSTGNTRHPAGARFRSSNAPEIRTVGTGRYTFPSVFPDTNSKDRKSVV